MALQQSAALQPRVMQRSMHTHQLLMPRLRLLTHQQQQQRMQRMPSSPGRLKWMPAGVVTYLAAPGSGLPQQWRMQQRRLSHRISSK